MRMQELGLAVVELAKQKSRTSEQKKRERLLTAPIPFKAPNLLRQRFNVDKEPEGAGLLNAQQETYVY